MGNSVTYYFAHKKMSSYLARCEVRLVLVLGNSCTCFGEINNFLVYFILGYRYWESPKFNHFANKKIYLYLARCMVRSVLVLGISGTLFGKICKLLILSIQSTVIRNLSNYSFWPQEKFSAPWPFWNVRPVLVL